MHVDPRAIAGIEIKIERANQHLALLHDEMSAWNARVPWRLVPEVHANGTKHFYRLRFLEPIPVEWAVILGEALHDLRSALDQSVYWLTVDQTGRPLEGSAFPVYTSRTRFYEWSKRAGAWSFTSGMNKIRGIGPGPRAFIEAVQPYPQRYRRFYTRDLRTINDLWNQDKHRLVHLWGLRFREPQLRLPPQIALNSVFHLNRHVLHDGAIPLKLICGTPQRRVRVVGEIGADLAFESGRRRHAGGNEILWDTASSVVDIIRKLTGAIGTQDRQITLATWSPKS
jgi:hypothetical protein